MTPAGWDFDLSSAEAVREQLAGALRIDVAPSGVVPAAQRLAAAAAGGADPTHYDAVWTRDTVWAYLALRARPETEAQARKVLLTLVRAMSTPAQLGRFERVARDPALARGEQGAMEVPHIRFDGASKTFDDVQVGGRPQRWNHRQNDALGLLGHALYAALDDGFVDPAQLTAAGWKLALGLPRYFAAIRFEAMEDAGAWEEIDRLNTSSVALVTSALERLHRACEKGALGRWIPLARQAGAEPSVDELRWLGQAGLEDLIDRGYARIRRNLELGGESPDYSAEDPRYRRSDAALLNLIYPAELARLSDSERLRALELVLPLVGERGTRRYFGDSYQCAGFWDRTAPAAAGPEAHEAHEALTDDCSSTESFLERAKKLAPGTEAQWFFDSWISIAYGILARRTGHSEHRGRQEEFLRRALKQLTPGNPGDTLASADGSPVPCAAFPESYNVVLGGDGSRGFAPSPITPLNWAKASMSLALMHWGS